MLQKAFFKVNVVDRIYETPVFEKTTPGAYEFTVPEEYNYVVIEYAGAGGGRAWAQGSFQGVAGKGAVHKISIRAVPNIQINGVVGQKPPQNTTDITVLQAGGVGYKNGSSATRNDGDPPFPITAGGGGGSTSVAIGNNLYNACGGSGAGAGTSGAYAWTSGKGGGDFGGAATTNTTGNNATDPNQIGLNSGNGYVKIWAGYDPYFKG